MPLLRTWTFPHTLDMSSFLASWLVIGQCRYDMLSLCKKAEGHCLWFSVKHCVGKAPFWGWEPDLVFCWVCQVICSCESTDPGYVRQNGVGALTNDFDLCSFRFLPWGIFAPQLIFSTSNSAGQAGCRRKSAGQSGGLWLLLEFALNSEHGRGPLWCWTWPPFF